LYLLAESHLSFHSWPEYNFIAIDCFTCGLCDTEKIIDDIVNYLEPGYIEKKIIIRGKKISENKNILNNKIINLIENNKFNRK
jgi:S-adenosylmethionine decarboxylase